MRVFSYFNSALKIISLYKGDIPLHHFLKKYFSLEKKFGSKDRRFVSQLCYSFYRTGFSLNDLKAEEKLTISIFLCNDENEIWRDLFDEEWKSFFNKNIDERIGLVQKKYPSFSAANIFPYKNELSETIDITAFERSFLFQPKVFARIRKNNAEDIFEKLKAANISFEKISDTCLAFANNMKLDVVLDIDKEVVIQDFSSQRISEFLSSVKLKKNKISVWDCCAASGGKSILANDFLKNIDLTVSDVRSSILQNLKNRFAVAGINNYQSFAADLSNEKFSSGKKYDLIICDVPCSGSGTWSRTSEQLFFSKEKKFDEYAFLQKKIIQNSINCVEKNGYFLYITCSVFKKENEEAVNFIEKNFDFQLIKMELLKGYEMNADTMFAALFMQK